jgi:hypothetical protein
LGPVEQLRLIDSYAEVFVEALCLGVRSVRLHSNRLQSVFTAISARLCMIALRTPAQRAVSMTYSSLRNRERVKPTAGQRNE